MKRPTRTKLRLDKTTVRRLAPATTAVIRGGGGFGNDLLNADDVHDVRRKTYYQDSNCLC